MLNAIFKTDDGREFVFGTDGNVAFDMDVGSGVPVNIGTTQGFSQIGQSVTTKSVSGRTITANGCIYGNNVADKKRTMRNILAPFSSGILTINDKYYCRAHVKEAPSFSTEKNNGKFTMQFFSPTPYFFSNTERSSAINSTSKLFSFPAKYNSHKFGETSVEKYVNFRNDGDVSVPFNFTITAIGTVAAIRLENIETLQRIEIKNPNGDVLESGEQISVYRTMDGVLRAEKVSGDSVTNILSWVSIDSNLFHLNVGDNFISADDLSSEFSTFTTMVSFSPAYWSVFEE